MTKDNIKHVFFDLDDTLWDFERNSVIVLRNLYIEHDLEQKLNVPFETFHPAYKEVNKALWKEYSAGRINKQDLRDHRFNRTFIRFGYNDHPLNLKVTEQYLERAPRGTHLKDDCKEILAALSKNYSLHIITNGFKEVQNIKIDTCGIRHHFINVIISEEHGIQKPDVAIFRLAENLASTRADECVMIGDNPESDIEGALNAGWKAIHLSDEIHPGAHHGINSLSQLKDLL